MKKTRISSVYLIPVSFFIAIVLGTFLLMLPAASAAGKGTDILTAAFTAVSSVCVTGLTVVDTYSHWSFFGQAVILLLVQTGGLGIISVAAMLMIMARKKFSLGDRIVLQDSLNFNNSNSILEVLVKIFIGTFIVELAGACAYSAAFIPRFGVMKGIWVSIFNSVSAFCNAGMDIIGPRSLADYSSSTLILSVTMGLIVLGGLGYVVWFDILKNITSGVKTKFSTLQIWKRFSAHTKLVLCITAALILAGSFFIMAAEFNNPHTIGSMSLTDKILNSLFESVTFRTAGFSTFPQEGLTDISCLAAYILMFIGGSPISTAGGVKTITLFLVFMNVYAYLRGNEKNIIFNRSISAEIMRKAAALTAVFTVTIAILTILFTATNNIGIENALFEVISASSTVGLSRGITASLNPAGLIIISAAMYLGRIGPISMAILFAGGIHDYGKIRYVEGNFFVG
ncbi:MAG: Trk family potassium uptake protein [Elusimicrobiales bacterium]|nr:Trk family potassium uptake protein [Elusimicrobiales bacterium]